MGSLGYIKTGVFLAPKGPCSYAVYISLAQGGSYRITYFRAQIHITYLHGTFGYGLGFIQFLGFRALGQGS